MRGGPIAKRSRVAVAKTVSAPIGGLNGLNALADMPETDAVIMDNWFPRTSDVVTRNGSMAYVTGLGGPVETLMAYRTGTTQAMFGIANGNISNVTNQGPVGAALMTGLANSRFQYVNFGTIGGRFLYAVNGADYPVLYDGTTWLHVGNGTGAAIASITYSGTTATLTTVTPHGLVNGGTVTATVSGATAAAYNVVAVPINVTGPSAFTYTMASNPGANATVVGTFTYTPCIQGTLPNGVALDPRQLRNCEVLNSRVWFVEQGSLRAWYLGLNAISGPASTIDLSSIAKLGGALAGVFGFSTASLLGMNNYTAFITTEGEVFCYQGIDPTNAATWSLVTRGRVGAPVGDRFWTRIGTDIGLISRDGVVPLSKVMQIDRDSDNVAISYKIANLINNDVAAYLHNFGWQIQLYPLGNMLIVNVPSQPDVSQYQYVMNTITNSWCRYVGLNANCFEYINDLLFYGGDDGTVYQAEIGSNDNGSPINATCKQAFSYFGDAGTEKRFTGVRPVITASGGATVTFDVNMDFRDLPASSTPNITYPNSNLFWPFPWPSPWAAQPIVTSTMQFASGIGFAAAAKITATVKYAPISWQATTFTYERGGPM